MKENLENKIKQSWGSRILKGAKKGFMGFMAGLTLMGAVYGCAPLITEGEIYQKVYEPDRTWVMLMPIVIPSGKSTTTILVPMFMHDDEDFIVKIKQYDQTQAKEIKESLYVSEEVYNTVKVGDWFVSGTYDEQKYGKIEYSDPVAKHRATVVEQDQLGVQH